jgi:hypothetical protein
VQNLSRAPGHPTRGGDVDESNSPELAEQISEFYTLHDRAAMRADFDVRPKQVELLSLRFRALLTGGASKVELTLV